MDLYVENKNSEYYRYGCALVTSEISKPPKHGLREILEDRLRHKWKEHLSLTHPIYIALQINPMSQANVLANSTAIKMAEGARLTGSNCGAQFSLGSDACRIILHQGRFVSLFASNFCAFRSLCSSTNSLPSSEYIFQRD